MKKKENLWQLLKRLDEQAGQFNFHLAEANRYFDISAIVTKNLLDQHERDVKHLIGRVKKTFKTLLKRKQKKGNE